MYCRWWCERGKGDLSVVTSSLDHTAIVWPGLGKTEQQQVRASLVGGCRGGSQPFQETIRALDRMRFGHPNIGVAIHGQHGVFRFSPCLCLGRCLGRCLPPLFKSSSLCPPTSLRRRPLRFSQAQI